MDPQPFKPYVPADSTERELTFKAVFSGIIMAMILGAANAYIAMRAGQTISVMFPAAVIAIALFRTPWMKGGILEQNISRCAAAVGEGLVAAVIFTLPALAIMEYNGEKIWQTIDLSHYWESSLIMLTGGLFGVLLIIMLRRSLCIEMNLPFPESTACFEIVKTGQKGESGASYVFGAMGLGALLQIFKDERGIQFFKESISRFLPFQKTVLSHPTLDHAVIEHHGGLPIQTPLASPALIGIGYVIGLRLSTINIMGGFLAWLVFIPLILYIDPKLGGAVNQPLGMDLAFTVWTDIIRPMAVGGMLVGAAYTLYQMRSSLSASVKGALQAVGLKQVTKSTNRLDTDLPLHWITIGVLILTVPVAFLFYHYTQSLGAALAAAALMLLATFILNIIGGYLVGIIGGSNQPLSGITLIALILASSLMVYLGYRGKEGLIVATVVTSVVCCAVSMSGGLVQDLKVGHLLGATPWKMEVAEILAVIVLSFVLYFPIMWLHLSMGGIGGPKLPAPQAGLMAQIVTGMVGGNIPWGLLGIGAFFVFGLIMLKVPSPMLLAVGMYIPFNMTFSIFIGGIFKWIVDRLINRQLQTEKDFEFITRKKMIVENYGILIASGLIAGEAITGIVLSVLFFINIPSLAGLISPDFATTASAICNRYGGRLSLVIFAIIAYVLIKIPIQAKISGK